jgi:hypothetical protein
MPGGWLLLLCAYLGIWQPVSFAAESSLALGSVSMRGTIGVLELTVHAAITAIAVAAAWALWIRNPNAPRMAEIALVGGALATVQTLSFSRLPHDVVPGARLPIALFAIAHATGWIVYLRRSRRVRSYYSTN